MAMWKIILFVSLAVFLQSCSSSMVPNGMSWDQYHAAKYQLVVTHQAAEVAGCQELGEVKGTDYFDMGTAKDAAEENAVLIGGNHLLYQNLWSEWRPEAAFRHQRELYHADGMAYSCLN